MSRYVSICGWNDAPHLSEAAKADILPSIPPYLRDAMTRGIPVVGSGAIYPMAESEVKIPDFPIPDHWPKSYGMDVGWDWTVAGFFAKDPIAKLYYLYDGHYQGKQDASVHAEAILARGRWIPGVIDPAANGRGQKDGIQLLKVYRNLGLNLKIAQNAVEAGIVKVWQLLLSGTLKVFASQAKWFEEFRNYHRDTQGNIVKKFDHFMDITRYWALSGMDLMSAPGSPERESRYEYAYEGTPGAWMV